MLDTNKIILHSSIGAFSNYDTASFSASYAGGNLGAGAYAGPIRATTALDNTDAITQVQVQFQGVESFFRVLRGAFYVDYPNDASVTYQIECFSYYVGGNLIVDSYIINQTGSTVSTPAITFNCQASLFIAPF